MDSLGPLGKKKRINSDRRVVRISPSLVLHRLGQTIYHEAGDPKYGCSCMCRKRTHTGTYFWLTSDVLGSEG